MKMMLCLLESRGLKHFGGRYSLRIAYSITFFFPAAIFVDSRISAARYIGKGLGCGILNSAGLHASDLNPW
jgi:hypothetical protein